MPAVTRYHPLHAALHWLMAALIIASLALGALKMAPLANADPMKLEALRAHMAGGVAILVLLLARIVTRMRARRPPPADTGQPLLDRIRPVAHGLLYVLILGMTLSGLTMAFQAGLFPIVYVGHGRLPASLWVYPVRSVHFWISRALMALIALHLAAVTYHLIFVRDRLLSRMSFGRRSATAAKA
ncbi:MAG: cytochrome b [Phenylobacterium sp.]